jgi:hypothetical protein
MPRCVNSAIMFSGDDLPQVPEFSGTAHSTRRLSGGDQEFYGVVAVFVRIVREAVFAAGAAEAVPERCAVGSVRGGLALWGWDCRQWIADNGLPTMDCRQWIANPAR